MEDLYLCNLDHVSVQTNNNNKQQQQNREQTLGSGGGNLVLICLTCSNQIQKTNFLDVPLIWQHAGDVPVTPSNHSDLMTLIVLVVNDGIRAGGLKNKLEFESDYAIPSLRPDGVLTRDSVPVGVLELKFPRDSKKKFKKENRHVVSPIGLLTYYLFQRGNPLRKGI